MKWLCAQFVGGALLVAPVRERGLKCLAFVDDAGRAVRRSRKGAWIEMINSAPRLPYIAVAPVRERGLK